MCDLFVSWVMIMTMSHFRLVMLAHGASHDAGEKMFFEIKVQEKSSLLKLSLGEEWGYLGHVKGHQCLGITW